GVRHAQDRVQRRAGERLRRWAITRRRGGLGGRRAAAGEDGERDATEAEKPCHRRGIRRRGEARVRGALPAAVARRVTALVATIIIAPTLAYVVFGALAGTLGESIPGGAWDYAVRTFVHGDFGYSQRFDGSMNDVVAWTLPVDLAMVVGSLVV